jgi:hypothetical protein
MHTAPAGQRQHAEWDKALSPVAGAPGVCWVWPLLAGGWVGTFWGLKVHNFVLAKSLPVQTVVAVAAASVVDASKD